MYPTFAPPAPPPGGGILQFLFLADLTQYQHSLDKSQFLSKPGELAVSKIFPVSSKVPKGYLKTETSANICLSGNFLF